MKRLLVAVCGFIVTCACGGGGGGGGGGGTNPPATPAVVAVSISPSTPMSIDQGQALEFTAIVTNDSTSKGVTWSISVGAVTGAACGNLSDTTTSAATYNAPASVSGNLGVTVTATSVADATKSASEVVTIPPPPTVTTTALTNATPNANYNASLQGTGGAGPLTWSLASGTLPTGLLLSSSGAITGDPTVSGASTFTVQLTDASAATGGPDSAQAHLSLTVVTAVSISTTALPAGSEDVAYLADIDASGGTPPYTWNLAAGSLPPGLAMQPTSGVISGSPTSQGTFTFTVAAEDSSPTKQTQTQALAIAIGAPGSLAITTSSLLDGTLNAPYNARVVATGGTPPYTWSIPAAGPPVGISLNSASGVISGTPSSTGTASFTVVVADSSSPPETQTQGLSITIGNPADACASSGNNAILSGPYAFSLSGFNDVGFVTVVGSFTADGTGKITGGDADTNGVLGAQNGDIIASASSYSVGSDNRGCATLATTFGTFVTHFALGSISSNDASGGRLIEWDSPSVSAFVATGQLLRQDSITFAGGLTGSYVFHTVGWDTSTMGGRDVCVGALSASGNTFNGLEQDCNDAWIVTTTAAPDVAGTYTSVDANGRGTGIIALGQANSIIAFYVVSPSQLLEVNADPGPFLSGEWDQQNVQAGSSFFTQASISGKLVFYLSGLSMLNAATAVSMETVSADGNSSIAITFYEDRSGTMQISNTYTCTYAVEPNGRVTLSSDTQSCGANPPVLYLASPNTGFIVDAAPGVDTGSFEPQAAGPFNNASISGNFYGGMAEVAIQSVQAEVDSVAANDSGSITGITDISSMGAQDAGNSFLAATYAVNSDGTFSVGSSGGAVAGIIISPTKFVMFSPSTILTSYPALLVMQK